MKTQYLLYDDDCFLCKGYTNLFIRFGFLPAAQRIPYQQAVLNERIDFDTERGKTRIALVSGDGEPTYYGLESLLRVIGNRWPILMKIGLFPPIYWCFNVLYLFISYNRKIISPALCKGACDCAPPFHPFWRWVFIVLSALLVNTIMYTFFNSHLNDVMKPIGTYTDLHYFLFQLAIQLLFFFILKQQHIVTYIGHLTVVSLIAAILIVAGSTVIEGIVALGFQVHILFPIYYGCILLFMFYEHKRRLKILGYHPLLSLSWVVSRLLLFPIAFHY